MLTVCLLLAIGVLAQKKVTGKVTDNNGDPIPNASVQIKGLNTGTTTNSEGNFSLSLPEKAKTLIISSIGYKPKEVNIGSQSIFSISLESEIREAELVIVTGYTREKKSNFAGAATVLSNKVVENVPVGAFDQALQGKAAGVQVQSASGQPGSSANVTIRGVSSIQAAFAQPLYVIDGVPVPSFDMQSINPNDFESITVLKDANAAALYGARGGIGVIVITTKRGKSGKTNFSFRTSIGTTQPPNATNFDLMNTKEMFEYEERLGMMGLGISGPGWVYSKNNPNYASLTPENKARYDFLRDSLGAINSDYTDILFRNGFSQNHEINVSGGSDRTRFFLSLGYFDQKGTDLRSRLRRYSGRFNLDHTIGKLNISWNNLIGYAKTDLNEGEFLGNSARNPFQMAWRSKTYENPYRSDGSLIFGVSTSLALKQIGNVLEGIENSKWTDDRLKVNSGLTFSFDVTPFLRARNVTGIDASFDFEMRGVKANSYVGSLQTLNAGYQAEAARTRTQLINTSSLVFHKTFNVIHDVEVGGYFEAVRAWNKGLGFRLYNLDPRLEYTGQGAGALPSAGPQNSTSASSGFGIRSYFATARYTFDERISINANIRRDGTSRILNDANKEITTWSAGAIWNVIREKFMEKQNIVSDLRLRASYGSVPNIGSITTGNYAMSLAGMYTITNYLGPQMPLFGTTTAFGGSPITGLVPTTPGNPSLKLEYVVKANLGLDFSVWNDRARFTVDAYKNTTKDLFVNQPTSYTAGFNNASLPINAGTMVNKGFEFSAFVDIIRNSSTKLTFNWNHAINKNEVTDLGLVNEYVVGTYIIRKGLPYGSHYTYHYLGADVQTGRPRYLTEDNKETNSLGDAGRFATFGTFLPVHVGGFGLDLSYKRFSIGVGFSYQTKVSRYNNIWNWVTRGTPGYHNAVNASKVMLTDQWQKPGDVKLYQSPQYDRDFTSADIQDAKFLRFRTLSVGYDIPGFSAGSTKIIKGGRFFIQAFNLFVWSPWKGPDPEDNNNISLNEFPNPRAMTAGIEINF